MGDRHADVWGAVVALLAVSIYLPTLRYEFVFDDLMLIVHNANLTWSRVGQLVTSPLWAISEDGVPDVYRHLAHFFRPVVSLSYLADKTLYGAHAWGFHLTNCLLHGLNVFLVFRVFLLFFPSGWQAGLLALLFGVHPNSSEVVAAIHGRTDLTASVFMLAALLAYVGVLAGRARHLNVLCFSLFFGLALGSKEQVLLLPCLLAGLHLLPEAGRLGLSWRDKQVHWACVVAVTVAYASLRSHALSDAPEFPWFPNTYQLLRSAGYVFKYCVATMFPWGYYALGPPTDFSADVVTLEVFASVVLFVLAFRRRPRLAVVGALWFGGVIIVSMLGASSVYAGELDRLSKRIAQVPMLGFFWILGACLYRERFNVRELGLVRGAAVLAVVAFATQTATRNEVYRDSVAFWTALTREAPQNVTNHYNLGLSLMQAGDVGGAAKAFSTAVRLDPMYLGGNAQLNLASCLEAQGDHKGALAVVSEGLISFPGNPALQQKRDLLQRSPVVLEELYAAAVEAQNNRRFAKSLEFLSSIHARQENYRASRFLAGFAYQQLKDLPRAMGEYALAQRYNANEPSIYVNLGYAYLELGDLARACTNFQKAISLGGYNSNVAWGLRECRRGATAASSSSSPPSTAVAE